MKDGWIFIDKPKDISSFEVIRKLRKILNIKKIGHAGTLDPFATGVLAVSLGVINTFPSGVLSIT